MKTLYIINIYYFLLLVNNCIKKKEPDAICDQFPPIDSGQHSTSFIINSFALQAEKKRKITTQINIHSRFVTKCQNGIFEKKT